MATRELYNTPQLAGLAYFEYESLLIFKMAYDAAKQLKSLVDSAEDKDAVIKSIGAKLYANSAMTGNQSHLPKSSKDADIDAIIVEFEGDDEVSHMVMANMKLWRS